jgi:hypothetical protein
MNRITIGVEDPDRHAQAVTEQIAALDIPERAVEIQQEDPVEPAVIEPEDD